MRQLDLGNPDDWGPIRKWMFVIAFALNGGLAVKNLADGSWLVLLNLVCAAAAVWLAHPRNHL